ncbi:hypothetical protein Bca101_025839 [Brassica carinata]
MTALDETDTALSEIYEGYYNAKHMGCLIANVSSTNTSFVKLGEDRRIREGILLLQLQAETRTTQERAKELDPLESGLYACMEEVIRIMDQANVATEKREANLIKDLEGTQRRVGSTKVEESMMLLLVRATSLIYTA